MSSQEQQQNQKNIQAPHLQQHQVQQATVQANPSQETLMRPYPMNFPASSQSAENIKAGFQLAGSRMWTGSSNNAANQPREQPKNNGAASMQVIQPSPKVQYAGVTQQQTSSQQQSNNTTTNTQTLLSQQQLNQKKLLKSYQIMKSKQGATTTSNLLIASTNNAQQQEIQNSTQPATAKNNNNSNILSQKRTSGSQQQIQAAIACKLSSQRQSKQQNQNSNQQTTSTAALIQQQQTYSEMLNTNPTSNGQHKNLKIVASSSTNINQQSKSAMNITSNNNPTKKQQSALNTELEVLCKADKNNVAANSSATKASSGGVRNTNIGQGLVGTPSATQRVQNMTTVTMSSKKPQYVGKYQLQEIVGRGAFGRVYKGLNTQTGEIVAIKMVPLIRLKTDYKKLIIDEIDLMKHLDHKNIVKYIETLQSGHQLCIVLEFIEGGSLEYLYKKFGCFSETLVAIYIKQVLKGLEYLHIQNTIHRDIKGGNILTTKDGVVKLADFGVATKLTEAEKNNSFAGTPHWMAPEVIEMSGNLTSASDIWSVGCTVYELLKGSPPNYDLNKFCAMIKNVREPMPIPDVVSPELKDFLQKCFTKDPVNRPSASQLLDHPWFRQLEKNKLFKLLDKHKLPQEVTNTIRVHLDSQEETDTISQPDLNTAAPKSNNKNQSNQAKNVQKVLNRQNVNLIQHQNQASQPSLIVKEQTAVTERKTVKVVHSVADMSVPKSAILVGNPTKIAQVVGSSTTVNLKKAIQDKLNAQAMKNSQKQQKAHGQFVTQVSQNKCIKRPGVETTDNQKPKNAAIVAKNHLSQMILMSQTPSATVNLVNTQGRDQIRANSASQSKTTQVVGAIKPGQVFMSNQFHPVSAANINENQSDLSKQQSVPCRLSNRPQTQIGLTTGGSNRGLKNASLSTSLANQTTTAVPNSSSMSGSHTTTAAEQRNGGALFDLRGNKRLFHLSKKMVVNNHKSDILSGREDIIKSDKLQTENKDLGKPTKSADNLSHIKMDHRPVYQNLMNGEGIPESQQVTEYSPDQDLRQTIAPAPHTSAAQDERQRSQLAAHNNTIEKHHSQQLILSGQAEAVNQQNARIGQQMKSVVRDEPSGGLNHPNFFRQWTEQTELTQNMIHGATADQQFQMHTKLANEHRQNNQDSLQLQSELNAQQSHQAQVQTNGLADQINQVQDQALAHIDTQHESPSQKLLQSQQVEFARKPNWPIKIYQNTANQQNDQVQQKMQAEGADYSIAMNEQSEIGRHTNNNNVIQKSKMLLNKSAEIFESKPFSKQPISTSHQPKEYQKGSQKPQQLSSDFSEHQYHHPLVPHQQPLPGQNIRNISSLSQHVGLAAPSSQQQLSHFQTKHHQQQMFGQNSNNISQHGPPQQNQLMMTLEQTAMQHQHHQSQELVELQQERMSYSGDKRHAIEISQSNSRPCRTALSSLSQKNYPSNTTIDQQARPHLQPLVPHQVSLTATGMYEHTSTGLGPMTRQAASGALLLTTQHRPHHKSLGGTHKGYGAGNNYSQHVMLTAKASQKQNRLRSPLGGFLQGAASKQEGGNTGYNIDYSHTIDASHTALLNGNQTNNGDQKDESDLGDDLDDEDESRTLFNQFVARTNLGLNRKPSNSTSLSGMTLPQKKNMNVFTSHSTRAQQAHQLPAQSNLSNQHRQPKELKQQIKKASKIGQAHAASIKQKLFLLDTISSGDDQLMQALAVNSGGHSCCSHSSSDMDDDFDYMNEHPSSQDHHRRGTGGGHHSSSCEFRQLRKDPAILIAELSSLIRAVTTGAVWPQYQGQTVNNDGNDEAFFERSQNALNDAFKDAFVSQLSFHDMIEMLDMTAEVATDSRTLASESIPCSALRLINQLAEGKITIQKQFFAAGLVQKLQRFTQIESREIKVEVAYFIGQVFSHAKELICQYMGCQGYQIQLDFIGLTGEDQFGESLYLIMFAIDSILVMFEEVPQIIAASRSSLSQTQTSQFNTQTTNKRLQKHSSSQISIAGMSYADLAKTLTKAGLIKPLVNQIQNFTQLIVTTEDETGSEFGYSSAANQSQQGVMYLERIFDILIDLAICGQHSVRKVICSPQIMCDELIQTVQTVIAIDSHSSPLKYMVAKWFVKLIIALTFQQQPVSNSGETKDTGSAISQKVIFELLGRSNVVVVLSQLIPLYTEYHANYPEQASSYLATLYETLKLLNLLTKMSASRSEQACLQGNVVLGLYDLITYIEELDQQQSSPASQISRSKKSRLLNACLQLLQELVVASFNTRTTLIDYGIPTLLLQLYNRKLVNYNNAIMSQNEQLHRGQQNKLSQGQQSLSLQSANSNLRANNVAASAHANTAAQNNEIVESIRDIFVVWVQQDDQTGQIMQEFLADQQSLI